MLRRREFLQSAVLFATVPAIVRGQNLNSKLQMAAIGCDGKGWSDTQEMAAHAAVQHVAFCDVDLDRTQKVRELNPEAPVFQDYREMLDKLGDKIDAVTVSTPDHMHAKINADALRRKKHIYCQKPLTHSVWEARQMQTMSAEAGVITRMGNQIHSHTYYRSAVATVQSGAIGKVRQVHAWCAATGHGKSGFLGRPQPSAPVPGSLAWDLWIGVAPMREFGAMRCYHPFGWRDFQDFGNGALGDFGCHILDPVFTALKIATGPKNLTAEHSGMNDEVWPAQTKVRYTFPGTELTVDGDLPISWYDGGLLPSVKSDVPASAALPRSGSLLIGEQGTMIIPHVGPMQVWRDGNKLPDADFPVQENLNHYHGWVDGCLSGQQPSDGFEYAGNLTEAVLLGNIGVRYPSQTLHWDAHATQITNLPEANRWLNREYRGGWEWEKQA
ncbi:MAG: Gfo/Idh/MocA family oxidoreductase [Planctomycetaceae bacterium]|nr:Gfo/Idh/MocA family oxidoreductase [Planctomycetaceae bacterium]